MLTASFWYFLAFCMVVALFWFFGWPILRDMIDDSIKSEEDEKKVIHNDLERANEFLRSAKAKVVPADEIMSRASEKLEVYKKSIGLELEEAKEKMDALIASSKKIEEMRCENKMREAIAMAIAEKAAKSHMTEDAKGLISEISNAVSKQDNRSI